MLVFPSAFFSISGKDVDYELAAVSGGIALSGDEDVIQTTGGGRWFAQMGDIPLNSRSKIMAWRAFKSALGGGVDPFVFPICDVRHQPSAGIGERAPFSDGTTFNDDTMFSQGDCVAELSADAALRATTITISMSLAKPLVGGERFSIDHTVMRHRAYQVGRVVSQSDTAATLQFHPPLREATETGTAVDFSDPRFVARIDGQMAAPLMNPKFASGSVRFVEDFTGSYI